MNDYMKNIRATLWEFMWQKQWTIIRLSVEFEIYESHMKSILSGRAENIQLSALDKISNGIHKPISMIIKN